MDILFFKRLSKQNKKYRKIEEKTAEMKTKKMKSKSNNNQDKSRIV